MAIRLSRIALTVLLWTAFTAFGTNAPWTRAQNLPDPPAIIDADLYYARLYHTSIVAGNYLYIDGGEVTFNDSGTVVNKPANDTYSIDLSTSWTNQTVHITQIIKTAPVLNLGTLWLDPTGTSFYAWGGEVSHTAGTVKNIGAYPGNAVYQFVPNVSLGSWNQVGSAVKSDLDNLLRPVSGAGAFGNGAGYLYGGYTNQWSNDALMNSPTDFPLPGIVSYDITANSWSNISSQSFTQSDSERYGQMEFVPGFGPAGLLISMGGGIYGESGTLRVQSLSSLLSTFQQVTIFEPTSRKWYTQTTTGQVPDPRANFCSVGVAGNNGTFEIFIYGGFAFYNPVPMSYDSLYVLSIPSFNWQKATYPAANPRYLHTCNLVGSRQMAVVGGVVDATGNDSMIADIWPLGLGIFDLTAMKWSDHYDPSAPGYETPAVVTDWYMQHGKYPASWNSTAVEALFRNFTNSTNSTTSPHAQPSASSAHSSNAGAITGGVVGGVLALVLGGIVFWFCRRRKASASSTVLHGKSELDAGPAEIKRAYELNGQGQEPVQELGSKSLLEVQGEDVRHEMP